MQKKTIYRGFTLIEIMIVVSIIAVLAVIAIPNLLRQRIKANEAATEATLKGICGTMELFCIREDRYPITVDELINAVPPYLRRPFNETVAGYDYFFELDAGSYQIVAIPHVPDKTGVLGFECTTGCSIRYGEEIDTPPIILPSCPFLWVWDGAQFVKDNDLFPAGSTTAVGEYTDYYLCSKEAVPVDGKYVFRIQEERDEISYIDLIGAIAVDHPLDVEVAPDVDGIIWSYSQPQLPTTIVDGDGDDQRAKFSARDDDSYYEGVEGDEIIFDFGPLDDAARLHAKLIIASDGAGPGCSLRIHLLGKDNEWFDTGYVIHPHAYWDTWVLDVSRFASRIADELKCKMIFTAEHKVDYVAVSFSQPQPKVEHQPLAMQAQHSSGEDVQAAIGESDDSYCELKEGESIDVTFSFPEQSEDARRSFVIVAEGYYVAVEKQEE
ncbi:competence type IV pilus major pilin ComGC [Candidatus Omnitrophota bacterium]